MRGLLALLVAWFQVVQPGVGVAAEASEQSGSPQATASQKPSPKEQVAQFPPGSFVRVTLRNNERLKGTLKGVYADRFDLEVQKAGKTDSRNIAYDDVKSITRAGKHSARNALISVGVAAGIVIVILGIVLSKRG